MDRAQDRTSCLEIIHSGNSHPDLRCLEGQSKDREVEHPVLVQPVLFTELLCFDSVASYSSVEDVTFLTVWEGSMGGKDSEVATLLRLTWNES